METQNKAKTTSAPRKKTASSPVVIDGGQGVQKRSFLKQGTTWAGILSIGAAVATGGVSVLTDPYLLSQIGAGIALLIAEN